MHITFETGDCKLLNYIYQIAVVIYQIFLLCFKYDSFDAGPDGILMLLTGLVLKELLADPVTDHGEY